MSSPRLLFVEVTCTGKVHDKQARNAIQRHVMRETAAERRRRPTQRKRKNTEKPSAARVKSEEPRQEDRLWNTPENLQLLPHLGQGAGRMDPFTKYPVPMDLEILFLIDYVYTCSNPRLRPFRDTWLPISRTDPGFFYEVLSHISQDVATLRLGCKEYEQSLKYHALAVQSVNSRLSDPVHGISDGVIGTILAFACFSHSRKDWLSYGMHMQGLLAIIRLRGGIHTIDHNRILRLMLSGIDVASSCFKGIPPQFPLPLRAISEQRTQSQEIPWSLPADAMANLWRDAFPSDTALSDIFTDLSTTIMTIKSESDRRLIWYDKSFVNNYLDPLAYRLLENSVEIDRIDPSNFMEECCRLGALILLSKIRRRFKTRLVFTGLETDKLRTLLERYSSEWTVMKPFLLWTLVLGAMEVDDEVGKKWFCELVAQTAEDIGLKTWDEIVIIASNLLWVGEVLDSDCENLRALVPLKSESIWDI